MRAIWDAIKDVRTKNPQPSANFLGEVPNANGALNAQAIEQILGHKVQTRDGVVMASIVMKAKWMG